MSARSVWQRVRRIWIIAGLSATVLFVGWCFFAYRASPEGRDAMASDSRVLVAVQDGFVTFTPTSQTTIVPVGLLFFPGALVEPEAYAPLARALATAGYPVILVPLPRRGAFGGADEPSLLQTAQGAIHDDERAFRWVIGGHSRGAVVATKMVSQLQALGAQSVAGLLLIGTTHPRDVNLSSLKWPVTKIVGTRDGIAPLERSEANRHLLPTTTRWVAIEGANHSQFGWYGFQPLDHFASISRDSQHDQMIDAVVEALRAAGDRQPLTDR